MRKGKGFEVTVIDGKGGGRIRGASVSGGMTDLMGTATLSSVPDVHHQQL